MNVFLQPLSELEELQNALKQLKSNQGIVQISGCMDAQKAHMVFAANDGFRNKIIVTFNEQKAREILEDYRFFDRETLYFPAKDILFYQSDIRSNQLTGERIALLKRLSEKKPVTVVLTFDGLMNRMAGLEAFKEAVRTYKVEDELDFEAETKRLLQMGYVRNYQVEMPGEFAVRGGILDIYPLTEENPLRIEMWGDTIDSLRSFEAESQRSIENLEEITLYPATELVLTEERKQAGLKKIRQEAVKAEKKFRDQMKNEEGHRIKQTAAALEEEIEELGGAANLDSSLAYFFPEAVSLLDYFGKDETLLVLDEPARLMEKGRVTEQEFEESMKQRLEKGYILPGQAETLFTGKEITAKMQSFHGLALAALDMKVRELDITNRYHIQVQGVNSYNNSFATLVKDLKNYKKNGYRVVVLSASKTRAEHLAKDLQEEEVSQRF